jgi:hypothetical protein
VIKRHIYDADLNSTVLPESVLVHKRHDVMLPSYVNKSPGATKKL